MGSKHELAMLLKQLTVLLIKVAYLILYKNTRFF